MKLLVWGTGRLAGHVIDRYITISDVIGFVESVKTAETYMDKKIYEPNEIAQMDYDAIIIANTYSNEIYNLCVTSKIDLDKVIFMINHHKFEDYNKNYDFIEKILGVECRNSIENRDHSIVGVETNGELCLDSFGEKLKEDIDYVRYQTFQLAVREIKKYNIAGAAAEAGVFRGDFAQYINFAFPEKKLYLFDSFEGFNNNEASYEMGNCNATQAMIEIHKQTNEEIAMQKMKYKNNVVIKKGFIPDTFEGLEKEKYCFVSLDVDFEESILAGLRYFYPALEKGGYIFIHDYNSSLLHGVEKAVIRYEQEIGQLLCKVPICDINGTLVITK